MADECSDPLCNEERIEDRKFCAEHAANLDRIRHELETDPKLLYRQRSDHPDRVIDDSQKDKPSKAKSIPICCAPGCFNERARGETYCFEHDDFAGGD